MTKSDSVNYAQEISSPDWFSRGRRNLSSFKRLEAGPYDIVAQAEVANEARQMLTRAGLAA